MLSEPLVNSAVTQGGTLSSTVAVVNTSDSTIQFGAATSNIPVVGDVLLIGMVKSNDSRLSIQTVTGNDGTANPTITISPGIPASREPAAWSAGGSLSINIIARHIDPKSNCSQLKKDINVYSFALEPEEHQPSGTCNFSRIESAQLIFSADTYISNIYAVNYNVLRIMSGMAGLAYAS